MKNQVHLACEDMLNEERKIKRELIRLLRWEDISDKINIHGIVLAYIAAIHAQIAVHAANKVNQEHSTAYMQLSNYMNENIAKWIANVLSKDYGLSAQVPNPLSARAVETIFYSVSAGVTILTAIGTVAFFAYNRHNRQEDSSPEKEQKYKSYR